MSKSTLPHCVGCGQDATRVVLADINGTRWSRRLCDACRLPKAAKVISNKPITF